MSANYGQFRFLPNDVVADTNRPRFNDACVKTATVCERLRSVGLVGKGLHVTAGFTETSSLKYCLANLEAFPNEVVEWDSSCRDIPTVCAGFEVYIIIFSRGVQCFSLDKGDVTRFNFLLFVVDSIALEISIPFETAACDSFDGISWFRATTRFRGCMDMLD
jgi:hypothetical protein